MRFSQMPYERPDIEELKKKAGEIIRSVEEAQNPQQQLDAHKAFTALKKRFLDMSPASIRNSMNTEDPSEQEKPFMDEMNPCSKNPTRF